MWLQNHTLGRYRSRCLLLGLSQGLPVGHSANAGLSYLTLEETGRQSAEYSQNAVMQSQEEGTGGHDQWYLLVVPALGRLSEEEC